MAIKSRASAVKTRFIIFKLLLQHDKTALMGVFSHQRKKKELAGVEEEEEEKVAINCCRQTIILHDAANGFPEEEGVFGEKRHGSRCYEEEDDEGSELEDEIDRAAEVFIERFRRQMMMQKQESFRRYQEMLARGV
ncbi:hypothetical protein AXF42_Ash008300 [Apostasia shenzhenica]|uniref:DUF761 domain-containing protein n=1 Tax=Apostasia shenzhenica TaxID=1088818 RepID=A0A2I0AXG8_9ASPA|nr:hypothetical protein AXF42_Ash008300 [Apostasia shenzhenica]